MQDRDLKELSLDLKELSFLLKEVRTRKELMPIVERHVNRLIKTLEEIEGNQEAFQSDTSVSDGGIVATVVEEEIVSTKNFEQRIVNFEEDKQKERGVLAITASQVTVFGEQVKPASELSKGLTLNDAFRFSRELFNGDKDEMDRVLWEIGGMNSLDDVVSYLSSRVEWDEDSDTGKDFIELLKKYFV